MAVSSLALADRVVAGHELRPVREGRLDLDEVQDLRHALHDVVAGEHGLAEAHELGHRLPIPRPFQDGLADERGCLLVVQLEAARPALPRQVGDHVDPELVHLAGCQHHRCITSFWPRPRRQRRAAARLPSGVVASAGATGRSRASSGFARMNSQVVNTNGPVSVGMPIGASATTIAANTTVVTMQPKMAYSVDLQSSTKKNPPSAIAVSTGLKP